jgi:hypothetical protein
MALSRTFSATTKRNFVQSLTQQTHPVKLVATDEAALGSTVSSFSGSGVIKLTHANGFSLEINPHADMASLKPLLELLRSVS